MSEAVLVTNRAIDWINAGHQARILHIFTEVVNLVNDRGQVVSLSTPAVGPGPFSMIMDNAFLTSIRQLTIDDQVVLSPSKQAISIGTQRFTAVGAPLWDPRPAWEKLQARSFPERYAKYDLPDEIEQLFSSLQEAYLADNIEAGQKIVSAMAGLGSGLTPTGDDVLLGFIFALHVWQPNSRWIDHTADWAAPLTTTLSAAYLRAAQKGDATIQWHQLVQDLPQAIENILSIGHTSGREAWAGFITTYRKIQQFP